MIHLIHGIRTGGTSPLEGLIPFLTGFEVAYPDYGYIFGLETAFVNSPIVGTLQPYIKPRDILIGHSNGCAIAYELMQRLPQIGGAVLINAALEQQIARPPGCPWIDVYFNEGDVITELAKLGAQIGITDSEWGDMGHGGYIGTDPRIRNFDCANTPLLPVVLGHSDFFSPLKLAAWGPYLVDRILEHLP